MVENDADWEDSGQGCNVALVTAPQLVRAPRLSWRIARRPADVVRHEGMVKEPHRVCGAF